MYFESSIINHIVSFLSEQCAALPILRTDLETIIVFSSVFDDMHNSVRNNSQKINLRLEKVRTLMAGIRKESTRLLNMNTKIESEKSALKAEKETWEAQKAQFEDVQTCASTINLNVGGHQYITSLATLRQYPDTMLAVMFSGRHTLIPDADGSYFIDRDGTHFRYILNLLRSLSAFKAVMLLPPMAQEELKCECDYYGLSDLMFPFKQFPPFTFRNGPEKVEVIQNLDGVFCVKGVPLAICEGCGTADYCESVHSNQKTVGVFFYLPHFKTYIKKRGGSLMTDQPRLSTRCNMCKWKK